MRRATGDAVSKGNLSKAPELGALVEFPLEVSISCVVARFRLGKKKRETNIFIKSECEANRLATRHFMAVGALV